MAKSKPQPLDPTNVCLAVTGITATGAILGLLTHNAIWVLLFMLPALVYESIRTEEGASTKFSSILLLILTIMEILLILFGVSFDLATYFGASEKYVAGYSLPLGDIKIFAPLLTAILSTILVFRTYGTFTKWLSIVIACGSLVAVFLVNPNFFQQALKLIVESLFNRLYYAF